MAGRRLDHIVVVDIESTCWEGRSPAGQESEIIEIGACLLNPASGERSDKESILVRPHISSVSDYCTRLTTLTPDLVAGGVPFDEACSVLIHRFRSRERVWASYGDYDRKQFERQCRRDGVVYPFSSGHINVKTLFALSCSLAREEGMSGALHRLGLPLEGIHHRGGDDAWNIAAILSRLLAAIRAGGINARH